MTVRRSTLLLVMTAGVAFAPAAVALAPAPEGTHVVAQCLTANGGALVLNGAVDPGCSQSNQSGAIGGAPTADTIINCRNISGCLSGAVNGPGRVSVPQRDTGIRHSQ